MRENFGFSYNDGDTVTALRNSRNPKKCIQGTPWYQILSNPKYSNQFNYIGCFVGERHKLIEDGSFDEQENGKTIYSDEMIRHRGEQSDLIMILLNLAFIPDDVIRKLESFKAGWGLNFKEFMQNYYAQPKFAKWNERFEAIQEEVSGDMPNAKEEERKATAYGRLNDELEKSYENFVLAGQQTDELYADSIRDYEQEKKDIVEKAKGAN
jgi:hypothetical protein